MKRRPKREWKRILARDKKYEKSMTACCLSEIVEKNTNSLQLEFRTGEILFFLSHASFRAVQDGAYSKLVVFAIVCQGCKSSARPSPPETLGRDGPAQFSWNFGP